MTRRGFTLIELLTVIAIMGLLGVMSIGGYRNIQRGMEERGVMQNVNQFIRSAYQRAQIDRTPVNVYFWNETLQDESDTSSDSLIVVGRAVAVRRSGRISNIADNGDLVDEFADLRFNRLVYDEDTDDEENGTSDDRDLGVYLYPMNGTRDGVSMKRSLVAETTTHKPQSIYLLSSGIIEEVDAYAYHVIETGGVNWQRGDAYGFEFAEIQLPHNYIFGTSFSTTKRQPVPESSYQKLSFIVGRNTGNGSKNGTSGSSTIQVSSLRPSSSGELAAQVVDTSDKPD